jgi:hypothetical protein
MHQETVSFGKEVRRFRLRRSRPQADIRHLHPQTLPPVGRQRAALQKPIHRSDQVDRRAVRCRAQVQAFLREDGGLHGLPGPVRAGEARGRGGIQDDSGLHWTVIVSIILLWRRAYESVLFGVGSDLGVEEIVVLLLAGRRKARLDRLQQDLGAGNASVLYSVLEDVLLAVEASHFRLALYSLVGTPHCRCRHPHAAAGRHHACLNVFFGLQLASVVVLPQPVANPPHLLVILVDFMGIDEGTTS